MLRYTLTRLIKHMLFLLSAFNISSFKARTPLYSKCTPSGAKYSLCPCDRLYQSINVTLDFRFAASANNRFTFAS